MEMQVAVVQSSCQTMALTGSEKLRDQLGLGDMSGTGNSDVMRNIPATLPTTERTPLFVSAHVDDRDLLDNRSRKDTESNRKWIIVSAIATIFVVCTIFYFTKTTVREILFGPTTDSQQLNNLGFEHSDVLLRPYSVKDPREYNIYPIDRSDDSKPGEVLENVISTHSAIPTNAWCENFLLGSGVSENNHVYQIPYVVDAAGPAPGIRTHPVRAQASAREVMMILEPNNALTMSAVEPLESAYKVNADDQKVIGRLVLALDWFPRGGKGNYKMQAVIARGSPYMSVIYENTTPVLTAESSLIYTPIIDGTVSKRQLICGDRPGIFSPHGVLVNKHVQLRFHATDMTWMVFFSEPTEVICSSTALEQLSEIPAYFELRATKPMAKGMVRIALVNNCTSGINPRYCDQNKPRDKENYKSLIIDHADIYSTAKADIKLEFPIEQNVKELDHYNLKFDWAPASMSNINTESSVSQLDQSDELNLQIPRVELLMMSVVHHRELMKSMIGSSNTVMDQDNMCTPSLHGYACPVKGNTWLLQDDLHPVSFGTDVKPVPEMIPDIKKALKTDIQFRIPYNYMRGAGDTYFSGKMLAKLGRILLIDDGLGRIAPQSDFNAALDVLRGSVEVWLNGSAISPFLYDRAWGGVISCGCDYNFETTLCNNLYPNCPAVGNMNMNFGFGFYNDHHFHLGYHIYAAAVVAKFDHSWGKKFYEQVMFLIRDIANPSPDDPLFVSFRHVDWYLGFSWAGGIVELGGQPYLNGRNWESSSEAISAYEGVALYGDVMASIFNSELGNQGKAAMLRGQLSEDQKDAAEKYVSSLRVKTVGRMLMSTTIRAARTYFHVRSPGANDTVRVYPDTFAAKAVGMMWSLMMEQQTWFGNEAWKAYGIQVLPLTPASFYRDDVDWLKEMLPAYQESCDLTPVCSDQGWSVPIFTSMARYGLYHEGWRGINRLNESVFYTAGGNGHSRSNSLWLIATWANGQK